MKHDPEKVAELTALLARIDQALASDVGRELRHLSDERARERDEVKAAAKLAPA